MAYDLSKIVVDILTPDQNKKLFSLKFDELSYGLKYLSDRVIRLSYLEGNANGKLKTSISNRSNEAIGDLCGVLLEEYELEFDKLGINDIDEFALSVSCPEDRNKDEIPVLKQEITYTINLPALVLLSMFLGE